MTMAMRCQKSNRLEKQQLRMCIMLFCTLISLLSLHDFLFLNFSAVPKKSTPGKFAYIILTLSAINKVRQNVYSFQK